MEDNSAKGLKQERIRRKRIAMMRTALICITGIWFLLSIGLCAFLFLKVQTLEEKMDYLLDNFTISRQIEDESKQTTAKAEESAYFDLEGTAKAEVGDEPDEEDFAVPEESQKENLAEAEDVHKVYLTFDDGPSIYTSQILDILKQYDIKATFFVIGKEDEESRALYRRIVEEGHTLGMHSYSHQYSTLYSSMEAFKEDLSRIQNYLYEVTGQQCLYYRFPGGSSNQVSTVAMADLISCLNDQGITYFDWNVSSKDATSQAYTPAQLVENVMADVAKYKTSIVLMHDAKTKSSTVEALGPMIEALQSMGAVLLPVDETTTVIQHVKAEGAQGQ